MESAALLDACALLFAPLRRDRGRQLFELGGVDITDIDLDFGEVGGVVFDTARGGRHHDVCLLLDEDDVDLDVTCDCRGPEYCEHGYALLLAEHARRAGPGAARPVPAVVGKSPAAARKQAPPPPPAWLPRLNAIAATAYLGRHDPATGTAPRVPTWVIDAGATRRTRRLKLHGMLPRSAKSKTKPGALPLRTIAPSSQHVVLPQQDQDLKLLLDASVGRSSYYRSEAKYDVKGEWLRLVVPPLFATGRVVQVDAIDAPSRPPTPVRLDDGEPFTFRTRSEQTAQGLQIHGLLCRGAEQFAHGDVLAVLDGGWVLLADRLARAQLGGALGCAHALLLDGPLVAAPGEERDFVRAALALSHRNPDLAPLVPTRVAAAPVPVFAVKMAGSTEPFVFCELRFHYGENDVAGGDPELLPAADGETWLLRNGNAERDQASALITAGRGELLPTSVAGRFLAPRPRLARLLGFVIAAGFRVLADGKPFVRHESVRLSVTTGIDWFDLAGAIGFGPGASVPLGTALLAHRRGERFVALGDGNTGVLPDEWLEQWAAVLDLGEVEGDGVRLRSSQALLLDALLSARGPAEITTDQGYRALRQRLSAFAGIAPRPAPAGFRGTLREYQQQGLGWLWFLRDLQLGGCLADDMGLGKTVQVLALLAEVHRAPLGRPSLLVVPRSLLDNWQREAARFAPGLRVAAFTGSNRWERLPPPLLCEHDVVLTTYGTVRSDAARFDQLGVRFEYAILDEAQAIGNAGSITSKAVRLLRATHRLALSGTPVQNHLGELWALFEFLTPGLLGKSRVFASLVGNGKRPSRLDHALLQRALAPFLLRRTKEQVLPELPPKQEQLIRCELDGSQRQLYESLRARYQRELLHGGTELDNRERFVALEALLRLRQVACHEALLEPAHHGRPSAKLDALLPMLQEIAESGHKALVFSQFTAFLAIVRRRLVALGLTHEYLDGQSRKRQDAVDRFQLDAGCPLFLISLKAGGFGLNLTAADYVFLLDPWWNPAAEAQAIDRTHRIGQDKKVTAYRLVAKDTVEEKVLQLQAEKRALADAVLGGDASLLKGMTREDLAALLA